MAEGVTRAFVQQFFQREGTLPVSQASLQSGKDARPTTCVIAICKKAKRGLVRDVCGAPGITDSKDLNPALRPDTNLEWAPALDCQFGELKNVRL